MEVLSRKKRVNWVACVVLFMAICSENKNQAEGGLTKKPLKYKPETLSKVNQAKQYHMQMEKFFAAKRFQKCYGDYYLKGIDEASSKGIVGIMTSTHVYDADQEKKIPIYLMLVHAYRFSVPEESLWREAQDLFDQLNDRLETVTTFQGNIQLATMQHHNCRTFLKFMLEEQVNPKIAYHVEKADTLGKKCISKEYTAIPKFLEKYKDANKWESEYLNACKSSIELGFLALYHSTNFLMEPDDLFDGGDKNLYAHFNGKRLTLDSSIFTQMFLEYFRIHQEIHLRLSSEYVEQVKKRNPTLDGEMLQTKLDKVTATLMSDEPFKWIFIPDWTTGYKYGPPSVKGARICQPFSGTDMDILCLKWSGLRADTLNFFLEYLSPLRSSWNISSADSSDLPAFKKDLVDDSSILNKALAEFYRIFDSYVRVSFSGGSGPSRIDMDDDAKWRWEIQESFFSDGRVFIHRMRLGCSLLGSVLEELRCIQRETYDFHLRPTVLNSTQLDLKEGTLFTGLSQTMYNPCVITNDSDRVTEYCTKENHEMCLPMSPLDDRQRINTTLLRWNPQLRPKWIAQPVISAGKETGECTLRKDYVSTWYQCQCGLRLDCTDKLVPKNEERACVLQTDKRYRDSLGQCRGGITYPCKTLPLAPGKFNETCLTGYCDEVENRCEDRPFVMQEVKAPASRVNLDWMKILVVVVVISGLIYFLTVQVRKFKNLTFW